MNTDRIYTYLRRCIDGQKLSVKKIDGLYHMVINGNVIDADNLPDLQDKLLSWYFSDLSKDYYDKTRITKDIDLTGAELTLKNLGYVFVSSQRYRGYVKKGLAQMSIAEDSAIIDVHMAGNYFRRLNYMRRDDNVQKK